MNDWVSFMEYNQLQAMMLVPKYLDAKLSTFYKEKKIYRLFFSSNNNEHSKTHFIHS